MDVFPVSACRGQCVTEPVRAICRAAVVKWNIFYISSNGFSLLINRAYVVCIFQEASRGRTFQRLPQEEQTPRGDTDVVEEEEVVVVTAC